MRIRDLLSEAQDGQAFANLAQAFHLPPVKVEVAVTAMIRELTYCIERNAQSRRWLAGLVESLGRGVYQRVLESPLLLGATSTQVVGNDALDVIAGKGEKEKMARRAALASGISEMIAEYLLPVVAAMAIGAIAKESARPMARVLLSAQGQAGPTHTNADRGSNLSSQQLPRVGGGIGFTGSTGSLSSETCPVSDSGRYDELAEIIRLGPPAPGAYDPAKTMRRILASYLGFPMNPLAWAGRIQRWGFDTFKAVLAGLR